MHSFGRRKRELNSTSTNDEEEVVNMKNLAKNESINEMLHDQNTPGHETISEANYQNETEKESLFTELATTEIDFQSGNTSINAKGNSIFLWESGE